MFGYVKINKPEMKVRDYELYRSFYCGLCRTLLRRHGAAGRVTLTYDATFLYILLADLCDERVERNICRCAANPVKKHCESISPAGEYCSDMNILLTYYKLADDWVDDRDFKALAGSAAYKRKVQRLREKYPAQSAGILYALRELSDYEKNPDSDPLKCAGCFGRLMVSAGNYPPLKGNLSPDMMEEYKKCLFHLGRFIYLCDAWDDLPEDLENGDFNPLKNMHRDLSPQEYDKKIYSMMKKEMVLTAASFEKLPVINYTEILRNIIYAGVWNRYDQKKRGKDE